MTTETQTRAETNGKAKGFGQDPKAPTALQASTASQPAEINIHVGGMRKLTREQMEKLRTDFENVQNEYLQEAQVLVDDISQAMADMASGRLIFEAVADNVDYLLKSVENVPVKSLGKHRLKPLSLKRLRPATDQNLSMRALQSGGDK